MYRVLEIVKGTTVDGPGFRTSIYLAGCNHHCHQCHNPQSWDPSSGSLMSLEEIMSIVNEEDFDVTLSGGDPLFNPASLKILINEIKKNRRNIWIYTGYTWEEIVESHLLLSSIMEADILVDGRYIEELKDPDLYFRVSSNQRIIDIKASISSGKLTLYYKQ